MGVVFGIVMSVVYLASALLVLVVWQSQHTLPGWIGNVVFGLWGWVVASTMVKAQPVESGFVGALWAFAGGVFVPPLVIWIAVDIALTHLHGETYVRIHDAVTQAALSAGAWLHTSAALWCMVGSGLAAVLVWMTDFRRRRFAQYMENPDPRF